MSEEAGDEVEGEGELAPPYWRVKGPRNKPTQKEREEHEATHVPFRDWCTRSMMGRGRTQCSNHIRRISAMCCSERRQASEHHEQSCFEQ